MITQKELETYADKVDFGSPDDMDTVFGHLMPAEILMIGAVVGARATVAALGPRVDDMCAVIDALEASIPTEH